MTFNSNYIGIALCKFSISTYFDWPISKYFIYFISFKWKRYVIFIESYKFAEDGKTYYGCETTLDENDYGIGYIIDKYSTKGDAIYYDGKKVPDIYGLYTVTASA